MKQGNFENKYRAIVLWSIGFCVFLLLFAVSVSYYLHGKYDDNIPVCNGSSQFVHFHPVINDSGSFLNLKLSLRYNQTIFIVFSLLGATASLVLYCYLLFLCDMYQVKHIALIPSCFMFSACLSRAIERIFWTYTMDFIAIKHIGILDVIDCYLFIACISFIITASVFSQKEKLATHGMSRNEKKIYKHTQNVRFWKFISLSKKWDESR